MPVTHATQVRADVERNRAAIITGAIGLLGSAPNASMQQIAQASGVNRATLYRHFTNRDQLLSALHAQALDDSAAIARRLPADGPVLPALRTFLDDAITIGERYRFILMYHRTDPALFDVEARATAPVIKAIRRGQHGGEIDRRLDPVFAAGQITMLVIGVVGLVERGAMTLDHARRQAQIGFGNTISARAETVPVEAIRP
ncbi:TetR family transcriptional regulator [Gordonia sp. HNM0687]|uniref:TetR family transcriptional regulator n=1 Tax=Gordonia mangrovi TaxID=2665643 RepID=A0A6L7GXB9_9ACTN|nr:TetR/AcrR family transcriptional regulator [Gordonia mangrovi]MXP24283.1 TetR family transcriptional regulator [Gordonia mangrovi]UVF79898.1 TetR/AcrR family transcriptional regulator [Gordonia mangrovi]